MTNHMSRRHALTGIAAAMTGAIAVPTAVLAINAGPAPTDPVIDAIAAYNDGMRRFNALNEADYEDLGGEDAVIDSTWLPPLEVLENWDSPAASLAGAISALAFALKESEDFCCSSLVSPMLRAALGYLENGRA